MTMQNAGVECLMELTEAEKAELLAMWKEKKLQNSSGKGTDCGSDGKMR